MTETLILLALCFVSIWLIAKMFPLDCVPPWEPGEEPPAPLTFDDPVKLAELNEFLRRERGAE